MKIKIQNRRGKKVLDKEYSAVSASGVRTYGAYNKYNKSDFVALINPLIDDVISRFASEYYSENSDGLESLASSGTSEILDGGNSDGNEVSAGSVPSVSAKLGKPKAKLSENAELNSEVEEAALAKARETAANLLKTSLTIEQISQATGLSVEEVESLKN